ncbi:hypothetical protein N181_15900 [Sinorhizobium fredii USDA 205]|nr:hypothetical protein N181_15900 [Sinorhizobium fredii USDA 205]
MAGGCGAELRQSSHVSGQWALKREYNRGETVTVVRPQRRGAG